MSSTIKALLLFTVSVQCMEHKARQWQKKEAINFFDQFFRLPQELQEKIWYMVSDYRSSIGLCIAKHSAKSLAGTHVLPDHENLIVGPNKNNIVVSCSALYVKRNHSWITKKKLPCNDFVYCIDQHEDRWIQAVKNQLKIFDYDARKTITQSGTITLKNPIAMALFVAKNKILSFSESGLEDHELLPDKLVSSKQLVAHRLFEECIRQKKAYAKVHMVKDMGYCKAHNIARLSCYTSHGFNTFFVDLSNNHIFLTCKGWVTFLGEEYKTAYNPSSLEKPVFSISFHTVAESLQNAKKVFFEYQNQ